MCGGAGAVNRGWAMSGAQRLLVLPEVMAVAERASAGSSSVEVRPAPEVKPEMAFYRKYTEGMLRRYLRCSMESGRVPSLMGREMFRGKVTSYRIRAFDDSVIFVHDVERCLQRLNAMDWGLLERIAIQEHTQGEAAGLLGMSLRSVVRKYAVALDRLTAHFLEVGLLEPFLECTEED